MAEVNSGGLTALQVQGLIDASVAPVAAAIPTMATETPIAVVDLNAGTPGSNTNQFTGPAHTHPSKARKEIKVSNAATYTWVYPTAFTAGKVPICNGVAQVAAGTTDLFNVQILGVPTSAQCVFQIGRISAGLFGLLLGALGINPTPATISLHMSALEP